MRKRTRTSDTPNLDAFMRTMALSDELARNPCIRKAIQAVSEVFGRATGQPLDAAASRLLVEAALVSFANAGGLEADGLKCLQDHIARLDALAASYGLRRPNTGSAQ